MRYLKTPFLLLLLITPSPFALAKRQEEPAHVNQTSVVTGSLYELRDKRRVLLMVRRSTVVDTSGPTKEILAEAFKDQTDSSMRFPRTYNTLARKLNNYMRKHQSISAARSLEEAEFIVLFNVLEFRRPLGVPHPYGELYVILKEQGTGKQPRIIWKTRKNSMWVEDAINDLLKELKSSRREG
jgi:hypothetical protein